MSVYIIVLKDAFIVLFPYFGDFSSTLYRTEIGGILEQQRAKIVLRRQNGRYFTC